MVSGIKWLQYHMGLNLYWRYSNNQMGRLYFVQNAILQNLWICIRGAQVQVIYRMKCLSLYHSISTIFIITCYTLKARFSYFKKCFIYLVNEHVGTYKVIHCSSYIALSVITMYIIMSYITNNILSLTPNNIDSVFKFTET